MNFIQHSARCGVFALLLLAAGTATAENTAQLTWQESGVAAKVSGYRPMSIAVAATAPEALKHAPGDLASPVYGSFKIGPKDKQATIWVVSDDKEGKPARLFVNARGDGDLSGEVAHEWAAKTLKRADGAEIVNYFTDATIQIPFASGNRAAHLKFYRIGGTDARLKSTVFYYCDYGFTGDVTLGDKKIAMAMSDAGCTGDPKLDGSAGVMPLFWFDLNGDGKVSRGEVVVGNRPFKLGESWWAVSSITADGAITIAASEQPEPVAKAGPDLSPGKIAPSFTGTLSDGKTVKFPEDFKGKVVLLDFWATWCGPCVGEVPNVVKVYKAYHPQGFEILGISLDREGDGPKLAKFTSEHEMTWQQVFDGKFWQAAVATQYGIHAIPQMVLVDGDTGAIIASENIRGEALETAVEKAVKAKTGK